MFPLFRQMKAVHGGISSADPSLFELEGSLQPDAMLDKEIRERIPDESRALDILQQLTRDRALGKDRQASKNDFIGGEQPASRAIHEFAYSLQNTASDAEIALESLSMACG